MLDDASADGGPRAQDQESAAASVEDTAVVEDLGGKVEDKEQIPITKLGRLEDQVLERDLPVLPAQ